MICDPPKFCCKYGDKGDQGCQGQCIPRSWMFDVVTALRLMEFFMKVTSTKRFRMVDLSRLESDVIRFYEGLDGLSYCVFRQPMPSVAAP